MSRNNDRDYFLRRAADEAAFADQAEDAKIAALHREMAEKYRKLAAMDAEQPDWSGKVPGRHTANA